MESNNEYNSLSGMTSYLAIGAAHAGLHFSVISGIGQTVKSYYNRIKIVLQLLLMDKTFN